jgi:hypothetical protein
LAVPQSDCKEGANGVSIVTLALDDDHHDEETVPFVGLHGRENKDGTLAALGFIWTDYLRYGCDRVHLDKIDAAVAEDLSLRATDLALLDRIEERLMDFDLDPDMPLEYVR